MGEVLTVKEIEARYPNEWVLLADPEVKKDLSVVRGTVVFHSPDRDEMYQKAIELRLKNSATLYTGKMPENMALNL